MTSRGRRHIFAALALAALVSREDASAADSVNANGNAPQLVVLVTIDQFSADLFNANRTRFRQGLATLSSGILYPNAFFAHGITETCAGHAVVVTGRNPDETGIVSNSWFDSALAKERYCTEDNAGFAAHSDRKAGAGPGLLAVSTVGDWLKTAQPSARVFAVAGKDRSAIMTGGHNTDGSYWFDGAAFDTWGPDKAKAVDRLAALDKFNAGLPGKLTPRATRWTYADPKCKALANTYALAGGPEFRSHLPPDPPTPVPGFPATEKRELPGWIYDQLTLDAAIELAQTRKLGRGPAPDFLAVNLSGTDLIGHAYGTGGPEMCDQLFRLDRALGRFLEKIDRLHVRYAVVVTADHGGGEMIERLAQQGYTDARHADPAAFLRSLNTAVSQELHLDWPAVLPTGFDVSQLIIVGKDKKPLSDSALRMRIAAAAVARVRSDPAALTAWTREDLASHTVDPKRPLALLDLKDRMALSQFPGRGADVVVVFQPLTSMLPTLPGRYVMGHSGPFDFNRRVPVMIWRSGYLASERPMPVKVTDVAPTLAYLLGIVADPGAKGRELIGK